MSDPGSFFQSLRSGAPAPPVDPQDLKRAWEFQRSVLANAPPPPAERNGARGEQSIGVSVDALAKHCSPGANVGAIGFRCWMLDLLLKQGLLTPWQHREEIDDILFEVFATYPLHVSELNFESLLQHIREKSSH